MRTNKPIPIYIRDDETEPYRRATTFGGVRPFIREMKAGSAVLFPFSEKNAVKMACSLLRKNEGLRVKGEVRYLGAGKFIEVKCFQIKKKKPIDYGYVLQQKPRIKSLRSREGLP